MYIPGKFQLFTKPESMDEDTFDASIMDLFEITTYYFEKVIFSDKLVVFKEGLPKRKKVALRPKISSLGERKSTKTMEVEEETMCGKCRKICIEEPELKTNADIADFSIMCDSCLLWYHYPCVDVQGTETFLTKKRQKWNCPQCIGGKGKGRGKKSRKSTSQ